MCEKFEEMVWRRRIKNNKKIKIITFINDFNLKEIINEKIFDDDENGLKIS